MSTPTQMSVSQMVAAIDSEMAQADEARKESEGWLGMTNPSNALATAGETAMSQLYAQHEANHLARAQVYATFLRCKRT